MTIMDDAIIMNGIHKHYGKVCALQGIDLSVKRGEIFGLLGANGAGKSTLIKILVGATRYQGSANVLGLNPLKQSAALRRQVGYMPQAAALYEDLSARDNVLFFGRSHGISELKKRTNDVLNFIDLSQRADDAVHGFSGGMKQRVSLACALVHNPNLLLLDEPTTGVDPKLREAFWAHFHGLAQQGTTIIVSTHQMDEAFHCDRVAVMREGKVLACDTPRGLMALGEAQIRIWNGAQIHDERVRKYPEHLPRMLHQYQLDPTIHRIEVIEDTLEDIVLNLIAGKDSS
jgi:ABC-2 type transport system ATP-binding protein